MRKAKLLCKGLSVLMSTRKKLKTFLEFKNQTKTIIALKSKKLSHHFDFSIALKHFTFDFLPNFSDSQQ